jgi:hypothetical protein
MDKNQEGPLLVGFCSYLTVPTVLYNSPRLSSLPEDDDLCHYTEHEIEITRPVASDSYTLSDFNSVGVQIPLAIALLIGDYSCNSIASPPSHPNFASFPTNTTTIKSPRWQHPTQCTTSTGRRH